MQRELCATRLRIIWSIAIGIAYSPPASVAQSNAYELNDSHFHLTNYIQQGTISTKFVNIMGTKWGGLLCLGYRCNSSGRTGTMATVLPHTT